MESSRPEIDHYDFEMPKELIAQHPLPNREDARLMSISRERLAIDHFHVRDMDELLEPGDCLVLNNTRVIPAKLVGSRLKTGGRWTGLFLESDSDNNWRVLCKTRGRLEPGEQIALEDRMGRPSLNLMMVSRLDDGGWIVRPEVPAATDESNATVTADRLLEKVGRVPLPHYIRGGNMVDADFKDYQTIYAKNSGAVAAPTAGLHLTEPLVRRIIDRGVNIAQVTLHVGIGTFRPVKAAKLADHDMHSEWGSIDQKAVDIIRKCKSDGGRVIAVGTTSVRVLETAAKGVGEIEPWTGDTNLFIRPPYQFKMVDGMLTNFHLPRSTLLVLVRTFGGEALMTHAYQEAVKEEYRFFSYGDAMLIL